MKTTICLWLVFALLGGACTARAQAPIAGPPPWQDEISGLWNKNQFHGSVKSITISAYHGEYDAQGNIQIKQPPGQVINTLSWPSMDEMLDLPIDTLLFPCLIEFNPRGPGNRPDGLRL